MAETEHPVFDHIMTLAAIGASTPADHPWAVAARHACEFIAQVQRAAPAEAAPAELGRIALDVARRLRDKHGLTTNAEANIEAAVTTALFDGLPAAGIEKLLDEVLEYGANWPMHEAVRRGVV